MTTIPAPRGSAPRRFIGRHEATLRDLRYRAHLFRRSLLAMIGLAIILGVLLVAALAPQIATEHPEEDFRGEKLWFMQLDKALEAPGEEHPLGTTHNGNDLLSMIVYGTRVSLAIGFTVVGAAAAIGIAVGAIAGYYGGLVDEVIMRVTDMFLSIPGLILAMAVVAALGQGLENVMYALIATWWPVYTRIIRGQVLSVRESPYVEAARGVGGGHLRVILQHVLPNSWSPVIVQGTLDVGNTILVAAALSFIGLGASAGTAEWGLLVAEGREFFPTNWWYVTFPGLAILLTVLGFNLVGDGLRDILDPKLRR